MFGIHQQRIQKKYEMLYEKIYGNMHQFKEKLMFKHYTRRQSSCKMDIKEHNNNQQLIDKSEINEIQIVSLILENAYKSFGQILLEFKYTL